jgi:serine/threonine-protein kinase
VTGEGGAPAIDLVGRVLLGKLRVEARLGEGGMGTVYRVTHLGTNHTRALKVMRPEIGMREDALVRFLREAGVSGVLASPYVVEALDTGQLEDGSTYVLMELLEGEPLSRRMARGPMAIEEIAPFLVQACEGLSRAHEAGIVHRDLKPDNLFVVRGEDGSEKIKILDFGIARFAKPRDFAGAVTNDRSILGTPHYMAPEQLAAPKEVDARADVYALGVVLYEALSGRRPYEGETFGELLIKVHEGRAEPLEASRPGLDASVYDLVRRAIARDPAERPPTVRAFARELAKVGERTSVDPLARTALSHAAPASRAGSAVPPPRRATPWPAIAAVALALAIGAAAWRFASGGAVAPLGDGATAARPDDAGAPLAAAPPPPPLPDGIDPAPDPPPHEARPTKRRPGALAGPDEIFGGGAR